MYVLVIITGWNGNLTCNLFINVKSNSKDPKISTNKDSEWRWKTALVEIPVLVDVREKSSYQVSALCRVEWCAGQAVVLLWLPLSLCHLNPQKIPLHLVIYWCCHKMLYDLILSSGGVVASSGSKTGNWAYGQVGNNWCLWCFGASFSCIWEWRGQWTPFHFLSKLLAL